MIDYSKFVIHLANLEIGVKKDIKAVVLSKYKLMACIFVMLIIM